MEMLGFVPQPNLHRLRFLALTELYCRINMDEFGVQITDNSLTNLATPILLMCMESYPPYNPVIGAYDKD